MTKQTIYDLVQEPFYLTIIIKLIKNGLMSSSVIRDIEIYEKFKVMLGTAEEKYRMLSTTFNLSPSAVKKIVLSMQKPLR